MTDNDFIAYVDRIEEQSKRVAKVIKDRLPELEIAHQFCLMENCFEFRMANLSADPPIAVRCVAPPQESEEFYDEIIKRLTTGGQE